MTTEEKNCVLHKSLPIAKKSGPRPYPRAPPQLGGASGKKLFKFNRFFLQNLEKFTQNSFLSAEYPGRSEPENVKPGERSLLEEINPSIIASENQKLIRG